MVRKSFTMILLSILSLFVISKQKKSVKILAIGNSISQDSYNYFPFTDIVKSELDLTIGVLYIGGASIDTHISSIDLPKYIYHKAVPGSTTYTSTPGYTLLKGLLDEEWDYITFQQSSDKNEFIGTYKNLSVLIKYVKDHVTNKPTLGWFMAPVRPQYYDKSSSTYDENNLRIHFQILSDVYKTIVTEHSDDLKFVFPISTAIANAILSKTQLKDENDNNVNFDADNVHMRHGIPKLIETYAITGEIFKLLDVKEKTLFDDNTNIDFEVVKKWGMPNRAYAGPANQQNRLIAQKSATKAVEKPYEISDVKDLTFLG